MTLPHLPHQALLWVLRRRRPYARGVIPANQSIGAAPGKPAIARRARAMHPRLVKCRLHHGLFILLTLHALSAASGEANDQLKLTLSSSAPAPAVHATVEMTVEGMPAATNVFDPDCVTLDLEITSPSGKTRTVPGFFARDYDRQLESNREVLSARGDGGWRVRWLPLEAGKHHLRVQATLNGRPAGSGEATIEVGASNRPGLVRVEPTNRRYFCRDDGTPVFLNGLCMCWYGRRGTYDYDDWLARSSEAGVNYIRLWMWPEAFGLEWDRGDRTHYRLDNAWRLDQVLADAGRRGILVMLCLDYHGIFEVKPDYWGGNNFWLRHPYNATNGGPCRVQNEFFTSPEARKLYEKRLRYLVARWSAFPNLFAWEFFNEIDNEYAYLKHADVVAWHRDEGRRLRALDPYQHLISSSFTGGSERPDLYALPEMDFAQYHSYNEKHPAEMMAQKTARFYEKYHKPFFVSEYGTDWRGWKPDTDPHFRALHQALWSGAFTGAAGTGMTWWWEHIYSGNLYPQWAALSAFLKESGVAAGDLQPARFEASGSPVLPFGMVSPRQALVWLLDRAGNWPEGAAAADPPTLTGAKAVLLGVADGRWTVEWWNTLEGRPIATNQVTVAGGSLPLEAPPFQSDLAARLRKE